MDKNLGYKRRKFMCYCTVFCLFYFVFEGNLQVISPRGLVFGGGGGGDLMEGFLCYEFEGFIF